MTYSLNELHGMIHKATVGSGLPQGCATAIATAGIWLARRQFPVCEIIARSLALKPAYAAVDKRHNRFDFANARAATDGIAAIDLILATRCGTRTVLHDLDEPLLLLGLVGAATEQHNSCITLFMRHGNVPVHPSYAIGLHNSNISAMGNTVSLMQTEVDRARQQSQQLAARYNTVTNNDTGWDELAALAHKTYVPASEHSRLAGAGAGLTDND